MDLSEVTGGRAAVLQVKRQSLMDLAKLLGWTREKLSSAEIVGVPPTDKKSDTCNPHQIGAAPGVSSAA
jgi:hypothetical protein